MWISGLIIIIAWLCCLDLTFNYYKDLAQKSTFEKTELKLESGEFTVQEPQLKELQIKLDSFSQKIDSLESLIRDIKANSKY